MKLLTGTLVRIVEVNPTSVVQAAEPVKWLIIQSGISHSLADVGVTEIVDQIRPDDLGVAAGDSLAVVGDDAVRRQTGKLRRLGLLVVLQVSANE